MTAAAAPWRDGERVRVVGWREPAWDALPLGTEGVIERAGEHVRVGADTETWLGPAHNCAFHAWERVPAEPPAPTLPVLHVRADHLPLMLEVVAAARAWAREGGGACLRLDDAVAAYERAIGDGT
jgi:hypothetical protein